MHTDYVVYLALCGEGHETALERSVYHEKRGSEDGGVEFAHRRSPRGSFQELRPASSNLRNMWESNPDRDICLAGHLRASLSISFFVVPCTCLQDMGLLPGCLLW